MNKPEIEVALQRHLRATAYAIIHSREAFRYGVISERDAEIFNTSWPDQEGA